MLLETARWVIVAASLMLLFISILMVARPKLALHYLALMASTHLINYTELSLRLFWGVSMMHYAGVSRSPDFMKIFGIFLVVTSIVLLLLPRKWHAAYAVYWANTLSPLQVRLCAPISAIFGVFLIWAVFP